MMAEETTNVTTLDWDAMPKGRNYLYYGREEMDVFHERVKAHIEYKDRLYEAAIDSLSKTREEVKEQRSNVHHLDTILNDLETHRIKLMDEITGYDNPFLDGGSIKFTTDHGDSLSKWFDGLWEITKRREIQEGRQS